jgi:hypothetical protein
VPGVLVGIRYRPKAWTTVKCGATAVHVPALLLTILLVLLSTGRYVKASSNQYSTLIVLPIVV